MITFIINFTTLVRFELINLIMFFYVLPANVYFIRIALYALYSIYFYCVQCMKSDKLCTPILCLFHKHKIILLILIELFECIRTSCRIRPDSNYELIGSAPL